MWQFIPILYVKMLSLRVVRSHIANMWWVAYLVSDQWWGQTCRGSEVIEDTIWDELLDSVLPLNSWVNFVELCHLSHLLNGSIIYSPLSLSAGSRSLNWVNHGWKILREKFQKFPRSQTWIYYGSNDLDSIFLIFTAIYITFTFSSVL